MPDKPLVWLRGEIRTPPFSKEARLEAGYALRQLQQGHSLGLPQSRPMPAMGARCHELRVREKSHNWRIFYRVDPDAIVILDVHDKKTPRTPTYVIENCKARARRYDRDAGRATR
jgi:phage-related protein